MTTGHADHPAGRRWTALIHASSATALGTALLSPPAPTGALAAAVALGMVFVGLPHGALDLLVIGRARLLAIGPALIGYAAMVALSLVAFRMAPTLGLLLFLAASAWHFGQADAWRHGGLSEAWALSRGALVVGGLLFADPVGVSHVLADLGADLQLPAPPVARGALLTLFALHLGASAAQPAGRATLPEALLLGCLIHVLQPTAFFGLYFLVWHSAPHLHRVVQRVQREVAPRVLWASAATWTLASIGIGALAFRALAAGQAHPTTPLIVVAIAVTLPHLLVVEWGLTPAPPPGAALTADPGPGA